MGSSIKNKVAPVRNKNDLGSIFKYGDLATKLSFVIFGLANMANGQVVKGLLFLALEIGFFCYMATSGIGALMGLTTLGTVEQSMRINPTTAIIEVVPGDNSMMILLWGVVAIVVSVAFVCLWLVQIFSGVSARETKLLGKKPKTIVQDVMSLFDGNIHLLLLAIPVAGIVVFTVTPLIYMILIAFTNYDASHQPPGNLFDWVGLENFKALMAASGRLSTTFWPVLRWTCFWAVTACFTCYFGGMILAMIINSKGIEFKKFWRTLFVITMAVPSFISLLVVYTMVGERGIINVLLQQWGFTTQALPFLTQTTWARATIIVVNMWVGVPVTMLMVTGILMNIPGELYESARIDGANPVVQFIKITFPYMWFITTPYLISNLVGNFNNFGVIYFLTGGAPNTLDYYQAGTTDLLVTWLYKLTRDSKDYNLAATIGIIIFIFSAAFSLISYARSGAMTNEEGFQ